MAINKPIVDAGPTLDIEKGEAIKGTAFVNPRKAEDVLSTEPLRAGQLDSQSTVDDGSSAGIFLYVAVEVSEGVYEWKQCRPISGYIDTTTGREWDQTANFKYSYAR